jgi:hypothetical protein
MACTTCGSNNQKNQKKSTGITGVFQSGKALIEEAKILWERTKKNQEQSPAPRGLFNIEPLEDNENKITE